MLLNLLLPLLLLGGLTAVIAGTLASAIVLQSFATRPMLITGSFGVVASYVLGAITPLPPVVSIQLNAVTVYPLWAGVGALIAAVAWRVARLVGPTPVSEKERNAELVRRPRARAAQHGSETMRRRPPDAS